MELIHNLWNIEDQKLLERLKKDILSRPTLARPENSRGFYIKIEWPKDGMGEVLLQAYVSVETRNS